MWAATHRSKHPWNKSVVTQVWPCITVLSRLVDNPFVLSAQVKKNRLSEQISQEERKRQEVGTADPPDPQFVAFSLSCLGFF